MPEPTSKRARGSYSKLICYRCRSRKIKCVLPDDVIIQPSGTPQPAGKECERCQQKGLECVVDHTTLGRPTHKRARVDAFVAAGDSRRGSASAPHEGIVESSSAGVEDFLLWNPQEVGGNTRPRRQTAVPSNSEMFDALLGPFRIFSALLSRDRVFASSVAALLPLPRRSALELISPELITTLDEQLGYLSPKFLPCMINSVSRYRLVWHRLFYPYIPELASIRQQYVSPNDIESKASHALFSLLCLIALDVPSDRTALYRHLEADLKNIVFHYGQDLLFRLPKDRHTILFLELVAEYKPLALVISQSTATLSIRGDLYITLAKRTALQLNLDAAASTLRDLVDTKNTQNLEETLLDTLQLCNLTMLEAEEEAYFKSPQRPNCSNTSMDFALETLKLALTLGLMPAKAYFLYHRLASRSQLSHAVSEATTNWKRLDKLADIIIDHEARCKQENQEVKIALHHLFEEKGRSEEALIVSQLCDMDIHNRHADVVGTVMFYGVMSGAHSAANQEINPEKAMQISEHIVRRLKEHDEGDPNRPPIRIFLEKFGASRMDDLERSLTSFIDLASDTRLGGVPFVGPIRHLSAEILFRCKDVVENNAARLKGWGGMHERVDTQLILFQECARRLEAMQVGAGRPDANAQGSLCAAGAKLIRSLHQIMTGWKRSVAEKQRRQVGSSISSGPSTSVTMETGEGSGGVGSGFSTEFNDPLSGDLFSDWSNWPQMDALDFTQLFTDEFSWEFL